MHPTMSSTRQVSWSFYQCIRKLLLHLCRTWKREELWSLSPCRDLCSRWNQQSRTRCCLHRACSQASWKACPSICNSGTILLWTLQQPVFLILKIHWTTLCYQCQCRIHLLLLLSVKKQQLRVCRLSSRQLQPSFLSLFQPLVEKFQGRVLFQNFMIPWQLEVKISCQLFSCH